MIVAYCGDRCDLCPRYIATIKNDPEELKEVLILMRKVGWVSDNDTAEDMRCTGCHDIQNCEYEVKECCISKNIKSCAECNSYPCRTIKLAFVLTDENSKKFETLFSEEFYSIFNECFFQKENILNSIWEGRISNGKQREHEH